MFLAKELKGNRLKYKDNEYSLTFDDGPTEGVTVDLGRLLQKEKFQPRSLCLESTRTMRRYPSW